MLTMLTCSLCVAWRKFYLYLLQLLTVIRYLIARRCQVCHLPLTGASSESQLQLTPHSSEAGLGVTALGIILSFEKYQIIVLYVQRLPEYYRLYYRLCYRRLVNTTDSATTCTVTPPISTIGS